MPSQPRIALVAPYPLLLDFLHWEIRRAFPGCALSVHDDLSGVGEEPMALVIYFQVRGCGLDLDTLTAWGKRSRRGCSVLVLSESPRLLRQPLPAGTLLRDMAISVPELLRLLRELAADRCVPESGTPFRPLTSREWGILGHLRHGVSNKAIARRLWISESTVKFHMRKLFAKTGCENRIQMALLAAELLDQQAGCNKP